MNLKEKFWLFASRAHDDDIFYAKDGVDLKRCRSRITPGEGAHMLGLRNIIMVSSDGIPVPFSVDAYGYMESFCRMKNVWWTITGSAGCRVGNEEEFILDIASKYDNVTGAFADDLFTAGYEPHEVKELLEKSRKILDKADKHIELWSTNYIANYKIFAYPEIFEALDGITVWNMYTEEARYMEAQFEVYEKLLPQKKKMLGIYLYDYIKRKPISVDDIMHLCELGRRWIKSGKIEGLIFLTNCNMGLGFECEYWLRDWIKKVGDEEI